VRRNLPTTIHGLIFLEKQLQSLFLHMARHDDRTSGSENSRKPEIAARNGGWAGSAALTRREVLLGGAAIAAAIGF